MTTATGDTAKAIQTPNIKQIALLKLDEDWFCTYSQHLSIQMRLLQTIQGMQRLSPFPASICLAPVEICSSTSQTAPPFPWVSLIITRRGNEKGNVGSAASIFYTKNYRASFAGLQALEASECPVTLKQR